MLGERVLSTPYRNTGADPCKAVVQEKARQVVFVPDVGIGCAEEQQLHELRQALGAKHLSRDGGALKLVADVDDSGATTAELPQFPDREGQRSNRRNVQCWRRY